MNVRLHPRGEWVLIALFLAALAVPGLGMLPMLGSAPALSDVATADGPDAFSTYVEDNFAFRERLVRWQASARLRLLGVSPSDTVIKGREGWLFYADDGALADYADAPPFTSAELEHWARTLQRTSEWLRARGTAYVFVIAPDKHAVYPEYMPATIARRRGSRIDELVRYVGSRTDVAILDLRPMLLDAKLRERVYHRTDTHWNDRGAFIAYQAIALTLSARPPGLTALPRTAFADRVVASHGLDLARMLGLEGLLREEDLRLVPRTPRVARVVEPSHPDPNGIEDRLVTEQPDRSKPRAVIFRDSFGSALIPFLSEHFSRAVYLWQHNMDPQVVLDERPAVVIHEWVGRRLSTQSPYDPFGAPAAAPSRP